MALGRYALVGIGATAVHYAALVLAVEALLAPAGPASFAGAVVGAVAAYWGNRRWTFAGTTVPAARGLLRFLVIAFVGAVLNGAIVGGATAFWGVHYLLAQVVATGLIMVLTYHLNRWWTFA